MLHFFTKQFLQSQGRIMLVSLSCFSRGRWSCKELQM
ncbi:unnamed protein product, partial [Vitis vinifera]|uniref:Uncharacterized protein n=1 Tax=Vitis vinifera TaxID=29760 RepID=D7TSY0_VITVI